MKFAFSLFILFFFQGSNTNYSSIKTRDIKVYNKIDCLDAALDGVNCWEETMDCLDADSYSQMFFNVYDSCNENNWQ
ncbi:hypothetical protein [Tenacibaculum ovolyticum]|uniref:hypothetical protein n=1 Tax=Tenacibaculum ovolyticum TaxID=104270 RepID=UPI0007ED66C8|nr:hypothetical protein [Tenacibaculum ovolyticum]